MTISEQIRLLSLEQMQVLDSIDKGYNVFITGGAGTGKSLLLKIIKELYRDQNIAITATTGIASVHIGGVTIHSWASLYTENHPIEYVIKTLDSRRSKEIVKRIRSAKILAIDEISMLSAKLFNRLDFILKYVRKNEKPFGGIRLILSGDFAQLPPIDHNTEQPNFCFQSEAWNNANIQSFFLTRIFRQNDKEFTQLLNNVRRGSLEAREINELYKRIKKPDQNSNYTTISTHNFQVEKLNNYHYLKLGNVKQHSFEMITEGKTTDRIEYLQKYCIAPKILHLKLGTKVMMLKNTYQKDGIINGSTGIVVDFIQTRNKTLPLVKFNNGIEKAIGYEYWSLEEYDEETGKIVETAKIEQIPLCYSWAITIHKSQGMTLESIKCDIAKSFAPGQIYVALSRVTSIEGLFLDSFSADKIIADQSVISFEQNRFNYTGELITAC